MRSKTSPYPLDITQLIEFAKSDPEAFESERKAALDDFFCHADQANASRLRGIQWRIDRERERSANPMAACVKLNSMMWDFFSGEEGLVNVLNLSRQSEVKPVKRKAAGKVVPFKS